MMKKQYDLQKEQYDSQLKMQKEMEKYQKEMPPMPQVMPPAPAPMTMQYAAPQQTSTAYMPTTTVPSYQPTAVSATSVVYPQAPQGAYTMAPAAAVGVDVNRDGRADYIAVGQDRNLDGIPDAMERPVATGGMVYQQSMPTTYVMPNPA